MDQIFHGNNNSFTQLPLKKDFWLLVLLTKPTYKFKKLTLFQIREVKPSESLSNQLLTLELDLENLKLNSEEVQALTAQLELCCNNLEMLYQQAMLASNQLVPLNPSLVSLKDQYMEDKLLVHQFLEVKSSSLIQKALFLTGKQYQ